MDIVVELATKPTASSGGLIDGNPLRLALSQNLKDRHKKAERPPGKNSGSFLAGCRDGWTKFRGFQCKGNMTNRAT